MVKEHTTKIYMFMLLQSFGQSFIYMSYSAMKKIKIKIYLLKITQ